MISLIAWIDGGCVFAVNQPFPVNFNGPALFCVSPDGISYGWTAHPDGSGNSDIFAGSLMDASGVAGHFSFHAAPRNQLTIGGALAMQEDALLPDGGMPNPEAYPPGVVGTHSDGGTFFYQASNHGSVTITDTSFMHAGLALQFDNLGHSTNRHRAGFDAINGAYFQAHGLTVEEFPLAVPVAVDVNVNGAQGVYYYGHESTFMYGFDTHKWHYTNGVKWLRIMDEADLVLLDARITALEAICQ